MDGFLARVARQRSLQRGTWYQEPTLIRKRSVFAETKAAKKEKSDSSSSSSGSETDGVSKKDKSKKKDKKEKKKGRCWSGYEPTPGVEAYAKGSCRKK